MCLIIILLEIYKIVQKFIKFNTKYLQFMTINRYHEPKGFSVAAKVS